MISFIVPVYKTPEQLLINCLESIIRYKYEMELICVIDSPGDQSENILMRYALKDSRVVVVRNEKNEGVSYSRNRALDKAHGEYIAFVDADDEIIAEAYEIGVDFISNSCVDGCSLAGTSKKNRRFGVDYGDVVVGSLRDGNALRIVQSFCWAVYPMILRAKTLRHEQLRFKVGHRFGEDFMYVTNLLCTGRTFAYMNVFAYKTIGHPGSTCRATPVPETYTHGLWSGLYIIKKVTDFGIPNEVLKWYIQKIVPMELFDFKSRSILKGIYRSEYANLIKEFSEVIVTRCSEVFSPSFVVLFSLLRKCPRLWFLPFMPLALAMRTLCHFKLMLRR